MLICVGNIVSVGAGVGVCFGVGTLISSCGIRVYFIWFDVVLSCGMVWCGVVWYGGVGAVAWRRSLVLCVALVVL